MQNTNLHSYEGTRIQTRYSTKGWIKKTVMFDHFLCQSLLNPYLFYLIKYSDFQTANDAENSGRLVGLV